MLQAKRDMRNYYVHVASRLSCVFRAGRTGTNNFSVSKPVLRNSMLVYEWRLTMYGHEYKFWAEKPARSGSIQKYVPMPEKLRSILSLEMQYQAMVESASLQYPSCIFNVRVGVGKNIQLPPAFSKAVGATVMLHVTGGRRVEHVLVVLHDPFYSG